jgi:hypothetical protein
MPAYTIHVTLPVPTRNSSLGRQISIIDYLNFDFPSFDGQVLVLEQSSIISQVDRVDEGKKHPERTSSIKRRVSSVISQSSFESKHPERISSIGFISNPIYREQSLCRYK